MYHLSPPAPQRESCQSHAHLQCTSCQAVIDLPVDVLDSRSAGVDDEVGFLIEPDHAALLGFCADCRRHLFPKAVT